MKILLLLVMLASFASAKVRVLTFHFNKPQYIKYQYLCLKKYLNRDFELIVMNDGKTQELEAAIKESCEQYGIKCVRFHPEWHENNPINQYVLEQVMREDVHYSPKKRLKTRELIFKNIVRDPGIRHCHQIQYALDHFGYDHDDFVIILDGDAFPIRPIKLNQLMTKYDIIGFCREGEHAEVAGFKRPGNAPTPVYLWVPFIAMNMPKLPNKHDLRFHKDVIDGALEDTGSHIYHYERNNPSVRVKKYIELSSQPFNQCEKNTLKVLGFKSAEADLILNLPKKCNLQFGIDKKVLHFLASSFELELEKEKEAEMLKFLDVILSQK